MSYSKRCTMVGFFLIHEKIVTANMILSTEPVDMMIEADENLHIEDAWKAIEECIEFNMFL